MDHAVSDLLVDRIDEYLGNPNCDPHGDPIPEADGTMRGDIADTVPLSDAPAGCTVRIARVTNQDGDFLRFLADSGLHIDKTLTVTSTSREAGCLTVSVDRQPISIGLTAAAEIQVQSLDNR